MAASVKSPHLENILTVAFLTSTESKRPVFIAKAWTCFPVDHDEQAERALTRVNSVGLKRVSVNILQKASIASSSLPEPERPAITALYVISLTAESLKMSTASSTIRILKYMVTSALTTEGLEKSNPAFTATRCSCLPKSSDAGESHKLRMHATEY